MKYSSLLDNINQKTKLTEEEESILISKLKQRTYLKGQYIIQQDDIYRFQTFVVSGKVRTFYLDNDGNEITGAGEGNLAIKASWPSQIRSVFGDHQRMIDTYFSTYKGYYFTGDGARRDEDGYYWITGRVDDVLNVSGHRMGTAEVESAVVLHDAVAESAVVGYPHDVKGQGIYCYVTLMTGIEPTEELKAELVAMCVKEIGPIAKPDLIQWAPGLPKTRSGKILRGTMQKIADGMEWKMPATIDDPAILDEIRDVLGK